MDSLNILWEYFFPLPKPSEESKESQTSMDGTNINLDKNLQPIHQTEKTKSVDGKSSTKKTLDKCKPYQFKWSKCGNKNTAAEKGKGNCERTDRSKINIQEKLNKLKSSNEEFESDENDNIVTSSVSKAVNIPETKVESHVARENKVNVVAQTDDALEPKRQNVGYINGSKKKESKYRTCGDLKVERLDLNLPRVDQSELEPVKSNIPECYVLKVEYDECFQHWFAREFLGGSKNEQPCKDLLAKYSACVKNGLKAREFVLYQPSCYHSSDPDDHRVNHPRKKPPSGADYHKG